MSRMADTLRTIISEGHVEPEDISAMLAGREERYGHFSEHALISQNIKSAMRHSPKWKNLTEDKKEALEMIAHKIARVLNGDPDYIDNWVDIAGYSQLIVNNLRR